jgi:hypothetical protein
MLCPSQGFAKFFGDYSSRFDQEIRQLNHRERFW